MTVFGERAPAADRIIEGIEGTGRGEKYGNGREVAVGIETTVIGRTPGDDVSPSIRRSTEVTISSSKSPTGRVNAQVTVLSL